MFPPTPTETTRFPKTAEAYPTATNTFSVAFNPAHAGGEKHLAELHGRSEALGKSDTSAVQKEIMQTDRSRRKRRRRKIMLLMLLED